MLHSDFDSEIEVTINGKKQKVRVPVEQSLLDFLRDQMKLTGAKKGCDQGACGACTVLFDGASICSCLTLAVESDNHSIITIEGLGENGFDPLQRAFIESDAFQCGFCTSGQILVAKALIENNPNPSSQEVVEALSGNLCRCGAYDQIIKAVLSVTRNPQPSIKIQAK